MKFKNTSVEDFRDTFIGILTKGPKNNTYKFALARFLLEYSHRCDKQRVKYSEIAKYFFKYYWLQECKSKLRHGPKNQTPSVITEIRKEFDQDTYPQSFEKIQEEEPEKVTNCVKEITRICSKDVIHRFQYIGRTERKIFYDYFAIDYKDSSGNKRTDPKGGILLNPKAMHFFKENFVPLYKSVILEWIRFLEIRNFGTPRMVQKIEGVTPDTRDQRKFMNKLKLFTDNCFYCNSRLNYDRYTHVDHVIPFDYIGNTEIWNLVLSCQVCNCEKLGNLPPHHYIEKLLSRNDTYKNNKSHKLNKMIEKSLDALNYDDRDINWHYKNARTHGYPVLRNFPKKKLSHTRLS